MKADQGTLLRWPEASGDIATICQDL